MAVSVALIVKNEEKTLARCLQSIRDGVDEIVVVDTGSTDATKTIAAAHGARVVDWAWQDDFAAARQHAFDLATGGWVMWLDADDVVAGADRIRPLLESAPSNVIGFYCQYVLARNERRVPTHVSWRERCVRSGSFRWAGRVHEVLVATGAGAIIKTDQVVVDHLPVSNHGDQTRRNLRILEDEVASRGDAPEPRLLFYLGREYADSGDTTRAIETLQRYVTIGTWADERYLAQVQIGDLFRRHGKYSDALDAYLAALKIHPQWPDAYFGLAATYYFLRDWSKVLHWTDTARALPAPDTLMFVSLRGYEFDWIIYYTNALYHLGRTADARAWTEAALALAPADPWHRHNLSFFASLPGEPR